MSGMRWMDPHTLMGSLSISRGSSAGKHTATPLRRPVLGVEGGTASGMSDGAGACDTQVGGQLHRLGQNDSRSPGDLVTTAAVPVPAVTWAVCAVCTRSFITVCDVLSFCRVTLASSGWGGSPGVCDLPSF